jgi:soluble lytic murein transglycosylase
MVTRYWFMFLLFLVAVTVPAVVARAAPAGSATGDGVALVPGPGESPDAGWHERASRILGEYLAPPAGTGRASHLAPPRAIEMGGDGPVLVGLAGGGARHAEWAGHQNVAERWRLLALSRIGTGHVREGSAALDRYLELAPGGSLDRGLEHLRRGLALGAAGQSVVALAALDKAVEELPWMADWAHLFAAEIVAPSGDTTEVRRRLEGAGPGLTAARGWRLQVQAARRAGDLPRARQIALSAARSEAPASTRAAAWVLLGHLRLEGGDTSRAREAYRNAMEGAPASSAAVDGARGLSQLGPTPEEWRMIASVYHRHGNQERAVSGFQAFLASGAGSPGERAQARLQQAQAMFASGRYAEAERRLLALADEPVSPRIAAEAMFQAGRAQNRQGRAADARRTLARAGERFPGEDGAARALYLLGDLQHDALELDAARRSYRGAASAAPTLQEGGLAMMRLGGLEYLAGNYETAASVFQEYRRSHPTGRRISQATFWAARSQLKLGNEQEARALLREIRQNDPLSFHGIRAGELLGEAVLAIPMDPSPPRREQTDSLVRSGLRRVDVLESLGRRADVAHEVERLRQHFAREDGGDYALAEALNERGRTLTGLSMGWDIRRREGRWNVRLLRVVYPFLFQELVVAEALDQGVDPYLVAAVIRRESAFNPGVTSSAGAIGLMQIMPQTGRGLAREVGMQSYSPQLLMQPALNVQLGVRYLANLLRLYGGDIPLTLSAYNAGPARASRWRRLPEAQDPELFMERIPFNETREYVRHVKLHWALYRELYPMAGHAPGPAVSD